jgi:hypothetical protein
VIANQRLFFIELHNRVAAAVKQGKKIEDLVKKEGDREVSTIVMPSTVRTWVGPSLATAVRDAYREIKEKKPVGDLPH